MYLDVSVKLCLYSCDALHLVYDCFTWQPALFETKKRSTIVSAMSRQPESSEEQITLAQAAPTIEVMDSETFVRSAI